MPYRGGDHNNDYEIALKHLEGCLSKPYLWANTYSERNVSFLAENIVGAGNYLLLQRKDGVFDP